MHCKPQTSQVVRHLPHRASNQATSVTRFGNERYKYRPLAAEAMFCRAAVRLWHGRGHVRSGEISNLVENLRSVI
jgi:hypothetical protein